MTRPLDAVLSIQSAVAYGIGKEDSYFSGMRAELAAK